jgi:hypothetical protein
MIPDLGRLVITSGELALARRDAAGVRGHAAEALALAAPRRMRLVHADALVLRGRARMLESEPDSAARALDDAAEALRLARESGYAWAERDALFLSAKAHAARAIAEEPAAATRHREASRRDLTNAETLAARLALTQEDLTAANAKAGAWLEEWKKRTK